MSWDSLSFGTGLDFEIEIKSKTKEKEKERKPKIVKKIRAYKNEVEIVVFC